MSERLAFTVLGLAQPAGSKRAFKHRHTGAVVVTDDNRRSRPWKEQVRAAALDAIGVSEGDVWELLSGPLRLELDYYMPRPKAHTGARGLKPSAPPYPTTRPDALKLARAVEDALTGVVWRDDAQIVYEVITKSYGEPARVIIEVVAL